MAKPKRDHVREERIHEEIIVDAYQPVVQAADFWHGQRRTRVRGLTKDFARDMEFGLL